ncbi:phospholipase D-like domain-containing protein [Sulfitobacter sp. PS-8MA]|uniref:phospholipase D-like domain-containing protein n=1 Tax=Sulfitobacter sp. PS-8MA TaxID=3237707 RepID=UPI0034C5FDF6
MSFTEPDEVTAPERPKTLFNEDSCWRVVRAEKLSLIVDAADYFRVLRRVFLNARRELLLIGWDFDFELEMLPGESDENGLAPDGFPNQLGAFVEAVVERTPELHVYLLKWNGAVLAAPGRLVPSLALSLFGGDRIHFALDGHHPFGACHHQKIVVADDSMAFCGGIDATEARWDTPEHLPNDPRRLRRDGSLSGPWHDATSALAGPAAKALAELSRRRWLRATGDEIKPPHGVPQSEWPEGLPVSAENVDVAIARTEPPFSGEPLINEIEHLYLSAIRSARDYIYIESQYFAAESICDAIEERLLEHDGPEIVIINPHHAENWLEDDAMHVLRERLVKRLRHADHQNRFRIYYPVTEAGEPIYVHAKIMVIDDKLLRLGSSNLNDRSMGFDTECDVAIEHPAEVIAGFRTGLMAEHLGMPVQTVEEVMAATGSMIRTIEVLNPKRGRGLRKILRRRETMFGGFLANTRLLDPRYRPGEGATTGRGIRPRHLALIAGGAAVAWLAWRKWGRWDR